MANIAFTTALQSEKEYLNVLDRMRNWEHYIDNKMEGIEEVTEYFNNMIEMDWNKFKKWQRKNKKK